MVRKSNFQDFVLSIYTLYQIWYNLEKIADFMESNVQLTSHIGRPFINTRGFINTCRKCVASAYKIMVVFKWAAI